MNLKYSFGERSKANKSNLNLNLIGCSDGSDDQVFQANKMIGCDGSYTRSNFRTACAEGWHVATASDYFEYGGKTIVPTSTRFIDVTWNSAGRETSLDNFQSYYNHYNTGGFGGPGVSPGCMWLSENSLCYLRFINHDYGRGYGCHCRYSNSNGVVCVK